MTLVLSQLIGLGFDILPGSPGIVILKLQHIGNVRSVLDVEPPPDRALLDGGEVIVEDIIHHPIPRCAEHDPERRAREDLRHGVVAEVDAGEHGQDGEGPVKGIEVGLLEGVPHPGGLEGQQSEVHCEEEHVLRVARRPAVRVAGLQQNAGLGPGLLDGGLDQLVDELRDHEAQPEEDGLELSPEENVGQEAAEADEDRDEGDPRQEVPQLVASLVTARASRSRLSATELPWRAARVRVCAWLGFSNDLGLGMGQEI